MPEKSYVWMFLSAQDVGFAVMIKPSSPKIAMNFDWSRNVDDLRIAEQAQCCMTVRLGVSIEMNYGF